MRLLGRVCAISTHAFVFPGLFPGLVLGFCPSASAQTFTIVNKCSYTVYPPVYQNSGWSMAPGAAVSFAPGGSFNGRIWGRIAGNNASPAQCATNRSNLVVTREATSGSQIVGARLP